MRGEFRSILIGAAIMTLAMQSAAINDAFAKLMAQTAPVMVVVLMRSVMQLLFMGGITVARRRLVRPQVMLGRMQIVRGFFWWVATVLFFIAIDYNDLPDSLALFLVSPLFIAVVAPLALKERFSLGVVAGAALGLVGTLVILRPGFGAFSPTLLLAPLAGLCYGCYVMATRHVSRNGGIGAIDAALSSSLWASVFALPLGLWFWQPLDLQQWGYACLMGLFSGASHVLIAFASQKADASKMAPFIYTELAGAVLVSFVIFGTLPDAWAFAGMLLIAIGGVWSALSGKPRAVDLDKPV